jgi:hypothetical protein
MTVCGCAVAQQYTPPLPSSIDEEEALKRQVVLAIPEEAMFRGTGVDEATRAEIIENLRRGGADAMTIPVLDPGLGGNGTPAGQVLLPVDLDALKRQIAPSGAGLLADTCALPGITADELAAIGRLLRSRLVQSDGDATGFEAHTPKDCPLGQLRYYSRSALVIAPGP